MPELDRIMTPEELGSTCSRTDPVPCRSEAAYKVRLAMNNPSDPVTKEMVVLACKAHFADLQADPAGNAAIIAWQPFQGPGR